ncbi:uncharacterized protein PFL1_03268 [Pseudozyma flocculosa PF-1]|uniref:Uncharacterized protein n=2 Tax=Pseudozyma flocculosa TaxID=84751 RepID=A0A5C3F9A7_9BASI|nr:uncharacterized protein PFL1_03268 [Pseudozyma flocculosa PF-1]EPQ28978.1 hypothetical protein PFL1_03268 [Pseudozyma flocculosa PF-1]SPO39971.1 uncharacterized protein PSFLO_05453 [Pseudozyma flocculosa]
MTQIGPEYFARQHSHGSRAGRQGTSNSHFGRGGPNGSETTSSSSSSSRSSRSSTSSDSSYRNICNVVSGSPTKTNNNGGSRNKASANPANGARTRMVTVARPHKISPMVGELNRALEALSLSKEREIDHLEAELRASAATRDRARAKGAEKDFNRRTNEFAHEFKQLSHRFQAEAARNPGQNAGMRLAKAAYNARNGGQAHDIRQITVAYNRKHHWNGGAVTSVRQHFSRGNADQARGLKAASRLAAGHRY